VRRRNGLVALAQAGAGTLGRRILPSALISPTRWPELEADGIVGEFGRGQFVASCTNLF